MYLKRTVIPTRIYHRKLFLFSLPFSSFISFQTVYIFVQVIFVRPHYPPPKIRNVCETACLTTLLNSSVFPLFGLADSRSDIWSHSLFESVELLAEPVEDMLCVEEKAVLVRFVQPMLGDGEMRLPVFFANLR